MDDGTVLMIAILIFISMGAIVALALVYHFRLSFRPQCCRNLGWHDGQGGTVMQDGENVTASCSVCGRQVIMDCRGKWVSISG